MRLEAVQVSPPNNGGIFDRCRVSLEYAVRESWAPYGDYDNDNEHEGSPLREVSRSIRLVGA
ncbi:MAG: hypothetical protein JRK53_10620 [Deltaproteobacteria bacterium]|nr:hypothetical protein [Deltaproteobacteria bacterium]